MKNGERLMVLNQAKALGFYPAVAFSGDNRGGLSVSVSGAGSVSATVNISLSDDPSQGWLTDGDCQLTVSGTGTATDYLQMTERYRYIQVEVQALSAGASVSVAAGEELSLGVGVFAPGTLVKAKRNPVTGGIEVLAGKSRVNLSILGKQSPIPAIGGKSLALTDVVNVLNATITLETAPNGQPAIKIVTPVGVTAEVSIPSLVGTYCDGEAYMAMHGSYSLTNIDYLVWYFSQDDDSYSKGWSTLLQYGYAAPINHPREQSGANTYYFRKSARGNFATAPTFPAKVGASKIRIVPRAGTSATVWLYAFAQSAPKPKGRICVVWDDGYESMMRLGYDSFASRGIKQTMAVIGSAQGAASYTKPDALRAFIGANNACVPHGPWPSLGAGNLYTAYPGSANPVADAIADMNKNRDYLIENGLSVTGADTCYVWPQGVFQATGTDKSLLDAAWEAGYTLGRSAAVDSIGVNFDSLTRYNRLACPIIGHTWAGSTAAEATNIAALQTAINNAGTNKTDIFLMLHRVQPSDTPDGSMNGIGIRKSDLETLAATIKTNIDAGLLEGVTMPEIATSGGGWWAQF